ncbi:hypothetical protein [Burkholderia gladioli]|uniref:hypothetical protein n=1 Tax=Burkholderia gladioli TaxID=28095 RepID=UPI00163DE79F|nr:hypothetical protein [Burkholderia gladioli]
MSYPTIPSTIAVRLNYQDGMFLTAQNMGTEQDYFSNWIRLQNRYLYTPGVLDGLVPTKQDDTVQVTEGTGFDADGDFLVFPGDSNNVLPAASGLGNPYGVFLSYPDAAPDKNSVTYDEAAVLKNAKLDDKSTGMILLAKVTLEDNTTRIKTVEDVRVGVTSRLPVVLKPEPNLASAGMTAPDMSGVRYGTATVDVSELSQPGKSLAVTVDYLADGSQAFSQPPVAVHTNVVGSTPYAINVTAIGTSSFEMLVTAVLTRTDTTPATQVNWLALPASPAAGA